MQIRQSAIVVVICLVLAASAAPAAESWTQWGGNARDFTVEARELAADWGESGPPRVWSRALGGGFASIVSDGERLYTHYRDGDDEIVVALSRADGKTLWEHRYKAAVPETQGLSTEYGRGPNATPLLADDAVVSLGFTGMVRCVNAADGKLRWAHDMGQEYEAGIPYFGHAASPLAVGKQVVIVAGGVYAFDLGSGKLVWSNTELGGNYASPRLVKSQQAGARPQIVTAVEGALAGLDTATGKTLWKVEHKNQWGTILTSPVIDERGRVFISAAGVGSLLVDPQSKSEEARRLWLNPATQVAHSNAVRAGEWVFASVGDSASFMTATSLADGAQAWKARGFARANLVRAGRQFVLLDFDGELALVELDGTGMKILTRHTINDAPTWTPPTLLGTTLYIRDESRIAAYDLASKPAND